MEKQWNEQFVKYSNGHFVGASGSNGQRGFFIHPDGKWETGYYINEKPYYASIIWNVSAYYWKNGNYFEATLNEDVGTVTIVFKVNGQSGSLFVNADLGNWSYYNSSRSKWVKLFSGTLSTSSGRSEYVGNKFAVTGKVLGPAKVPIPSYCRHKWGKVECIYSEGRTSFDGVMMMIENDNGWKWYGESRGDKAGGYGIKYSTKTGTDWFEYGMFKTNTNGSVPYIPYSDHIFICLTADTDGTINISVKNSSDPYREVMVYLDKSGPRLWAKTPNWDSIKVNQSFSKVSFKYDGKPEKEYYL